MIPDLNLNEGLLQAPLSAWQDLWPWVREGSASALLHACDPLADEGASSNPARQLNESIAQESANYYRAQASFSESIILDSAEREIYDELTHFLARSDSRELVGAVFGEVWHQDDLIGNIQSYLNDAKVPALEVLATSAANKAFRASYSTDTDTIYFDRDFLAIASSEELVDVYLEELGHYWQSQAGDFDIAGDEGELLTALILEKDLSPATVQQIAQEDDRRWLLLDGQWVAIEQASWLQTDELQIAEPLSGIYYLPKSDLGLLPTLSFQAREKQAKYSNEIGFYLTDSLGRVDGILPGEEGYTEAVLKQPERRMLFNSNATEGSWQEVILNSGVYFGMYLVAHGSSEQVLGTLNNNPNRPNVYFSETAANPDGVQHMRWQSLGNGIFTVQWEDLWGGGDNDFNDAVFSLEQKGIRTPGNSGQLVPFNLNKIPSEAAYHNEMGFYYVDDAEGRVNGIAPGDINYAQEAFKAGNYQPVFEQAGSATNRQFTLAGNRYIGLYLIADSNRDAFLRVNPTNKPGNGANAYFSYPRANPTQISNLYNYSGDQWGWEDLLEGGDKDYNDLIFSLGFGTPRDVTVTVNDVFTTESASDPTVAEFTLKLSEAHQNPVTISYETVDQSAVAGLDYLFAAGNVTFAPGVTEQRVAVTVLADGLFEQTEQFGLQLSGVANVQVVDGFALGFIKNIDPEEEEPPPPVNNKPSVRLENVVESLDDNTDTTIRQRLADIIVSDDSVGNNQLSLSGNDAVFFEIEDRNLYLKEGTALDFEVKSEYAVMVRVDDAGVGESPDDSVLYTLSVSTLLKEDTNFSSTIQTPIHVSATPSILHIKLEGLSFDETDTNSINDAFEMEFVDTSGHSLVHAIGSEKTAFFNITEGFDPELAPGVAFDQTAGIVSVSLVGVLPNSIGNLVLRFINNDQDIASQVRILGARLENAQAGSTPPVDTSRISSFQNLVAPPSLSGLVDVSNSIQTLYQRTSFNQSNDLIYADFSLQNIGSYGVNTNLLVAIKNISDPSVRARDTDGFTLDGLPYYNLSNLLINGSLDSNQSTESRSLVFFNPNRVQFDYEVVVLSVVNSDPVFLSQPELEIIQGQGYHYDVDAADPDSDPLNYSLLVAPQGMTIDEISGLILWHPAMTNLGSHNVIVKVEDRRGGISFQTYTLSVTDPLPNRPPVFTSIPTGDGNIFAQYSYQAIANDADNDNLSYSLVAAPESMTIDPVTGLVTWIPNATQSGLAEVQIKVSDDKGGNAIQVYDVAISPSRTNKPPVFVSDPVTQFNFAGPGNEAQGSVSPDRIDLSLDLNEILESKVTLTLPNDESSASADIVFIVDESGSMSGLQTWLRDMVDDLDTKLIANGVGDNKYALIGFGNDGIVGRVFDFGSGVRFGSANQFINVSRGLQISGGTEDGYNGINTAFTNLTFRPGAALNLILVTDEDRDIFSKELNFANTLDSITQRNALLNAVVNGSFTSDVRSNVALGIDANGNSYIQDSKGGYTLSSIGNITGSEATKRDYIDLALASGGAAWDLNQLSKGGFSAQSFTNAFIDIKTKEILSQLPVSVVASDSTIKFKNLTGPLSGYRAGETLSFDIQITGDAIPRTFDLLLIRPNTGLILGSIPVTINNYYIYRAQAIDPDRDPLTYSILESPNGATIDSLTGNIYWKPGYPGRYTFKIAAHDDRGGFSIQEYTVHVNASLNNNAPIITSLPLTSAIASRHFIHQVSAFDIDGDSLTYYLYESPEGLTIDMNSGLISWVPSISQVGDHSVKIRVLDRRGEESIQSFNIIVSAGAANRNPVIESTTALQAVGGELYSYKIKASDADADVLIFDLPVAPEGMTIDPSTGLLAWIPTLNQLGTHDAIVRVKDGYQGFDLHAFSISAAASNVSPVFTSPASKSFKVQSGKTLQIKSTAMDANNDILHYSLVDNKLDEMRIDAATGLVTWNPDDTQIGAHQFTIKVADGKGGESFQTVSFTVNPATYNEAPSFTSTPRNTTRIGSPYFYQVEVIDPNGDVLTYSLVNAPTGMTLEKGLISWESTAAQAGHHAVTIQATDGTLSTEQTYQITVSHQASNRAPIITSAPNLATNINQIYSYNLTGQDPDGDFFLWVLDQAPSGMVLDQQTGALRWQPQSSQLGHHQVIVRLLDTYGDSSSQSFTLNVNGANSPANILSNPLTRAVVNQTYTYAVVAVDPESSPLIYRLGSRPNGMTIDATGKVQWMPTEAGSYDIDVSVTDNQGATTTQTYRLEVGTAAINQAPTIISMPSLVANVGSSYQYQVEASDPDAQILRYQLLESPQGMSIGAASGLLNWTNPVNGHYQVVVAAFDSEGLSATQGYTLKAKTNSLPVIRSTPGLEVSPNQIYRYDIRAVDPDGDSLRYSLDDTSQAMGMSLDAQGRFTWIPTNSQLGDHAISLTVIDGAGGRTHQTFVLKVTADTMAPKVRVNRSSSLINQGSTVSFQVVATDNVSVANLQLLINGIPVVTDSNGVVSFTAIAAGEITAKAVALDAAGNRAEATTTVNVFDPTDTEAPTVRLDLSGIENGEITGPVEIKGSVMDANLDYYVLEVAPADGSQPFKEMFRGRSLVNNGALGVLDPTLLINDTYQVRLIAYDVNGLGNSVSAALDIKGNLKLGNFQLAFTDIEIPVAGIPITLTRTYDTLASNSKSDFGYGWRMEFRNAQVRTSLPKDELYEELGIRGVGFKEGDSVYVTLPGGKRERFTFKLEATNVLVNSFLRRRGLYKPVFVADKGSTSILSVDTAGIVLIRGDDNRVVPLSGGSAFSYYNPQDWGNAYKLTTKEGVAYNINATTGDINAITNRNGDVLTFSDGGIVSSNGQQVTFERDPQGRIVAAIDPLGMRVTYQYDAQGDLVKVTDRDKNSTTFEYNDRRPHYLDKVIDPLGQTGIRNEYDQNGRLAKVFNALGNGAQLGYNLENSLYTTKDALGNSTTYEYDLRGNVITEVDAKGGISRRTYDADNNKLSETNPAGATTHYTYDRRGNKLTETDALGNITRYTYNANGDLLSTANALGNTVINTYDSNGNPTAISGLANGPINLVYGAGGLLNSLITAEGTTTYEYDRQGNITKEINPLGHATTYTYDGNGNRLTETRRMKTPDGFQTLVTTMQYNALGDVIKVTDALGNVTQMSYDPNGHKSQEIDALGRVTKFVYSSVGQLLETIYPDLSTDNDSDNPRIRKEYDAANRLVAEIDELGRRTEFQYDAMGRLTFTLFPDLTPSNASDNPRTESRYDDVGRVIAEVDERGNVTRYEYDPLGRRTKTILPDGTPDNDSDNPQLIVSYDALGRQLTQVDPLGRTTQFLYDSLGRSIHQIFADQTDILTTYDLAGRVIAKTDQMGNKTQYEYNAVGQLTSVIDSLNQRTEYQYNEQGNLISQKDALGNVTRYEYDGLGRRIATDLPLGQNATMTYDAVGNLLSTTDFNGELTHFEYDERNRLTSQIFPDNRRTVYTYTLTGQRATETSSLGTINFSYDYRDNLLSRVDTDGMKIEYSYDVSNNRTAVKIPSGQTRYTFDEQNRLKRVTDPQAGVSNYTYDLAGNLIKATLANGTTETREYDLLNRLLYLQNSNGGGVINSFLYTIDKAGNRLAVVEHDGRQSNFKYDALYRLSREEVIDGTTRAISYAYDPVSNRLARNDSLDGTTAYEYDGNDRLLKEETNGVTTTYTYDSNGNILTKTVGTATTTYQWNVENRLIGADTDGDGINDVTNEYDGDGVRTRQTVAGEETRFLLDKNRDYAQVLEEYTPSNIIKASYVYGHDLISQSRDTERSFYHVDGLGSTRALTDINGLLTDAYAYETFGEMTEQFGNTQNSYLFAGEQRDLHLGLDYLRARYLDVNNGRFYGRDLFKGFYINPITLNKYVYANQNPVNIIDPSGKFGVAAFAIGFSIGFGLGSAAHYPATGIKKEQGGNSSLGPYFDPFDNRYHRFYLKTNIASGDEKRSKEVYELVRRFPAPRAFGDYRLPVYNGQRSDLIGITSPNPVVHILYEGELALVNATLPGHLLHPGKTVRQVVRKGGNISIETTGDGIGRFPLVNYVMFKILFKALDTAIMLYLD